MSMEVEAKAYAENLKDIEERITTMGANLIWEGLQVDTYYTHPSKNFAETDEALRIREEDGKETLTYKGPKIDENTKTREEIKIHVDDSISTKELLKKLGFKEFGVVKKHRKKFLLDDLKICLDKVENLGEFVEIEMMVPHDDSNVDIDDLRRKVLETLKKLGLKKTERRSYLELIYTNLD